MSNIRKSMVGLLLLGLAVTAIGAGTFASFSASTTNSATFQTGTLVLSNDLPGGSVCTSAGSGNNTDDNDETCEVLFSSLTDLKPGDTLIDGVELTLDNVGTLDPSAFTWAGSCTTGDNTDSVYTGSVAGDPCDAIEMYIQEYSDAAFENASGACFFPAGGTPCDDEFAPDDDALSDLAAAAGSAGNLAGPRYFKIHTNFDAGFGNEYQGKRSDLAITWSLAQ